MPLRKVKKVSDEPLKKVEPTKQVEPVKEVAKKVDEPVKEEIKTQSPPASLSKKEWYGLGLTGSHPDVNKFKGATKLKGKSVGETLLEAIRLWLKENT